MEQINFTDNRDIHIKFGKTEMPQTIGGVTRARDTMDDYSVLLNSALDSVHQTKAFLHEMLHIYHKDSWSDRDRDEIEAERRAELRAILELIVEEDAAKA